MAHLAVRSAVHSFLVILFTFLLFALRAEGVSAAAGGQQAAVIAGRVLDPLGARVPTATVVLFRGDDRVANTVTDARGEFVFADVVSGRYRLEAAAPGFTTGTSAGFFVGGTGRTGLEITLLIGPFAQDTVVSASAVELPQAQVGASVTVIDRAVLDASGKPDIHGALRTVPGAYVVQTGARGGATSLFLRGGSSGFAKVIVDGVPVNEIGGAFNFGDLQATGLDRIEVLRGPNSVLYGTDALSGVVTLTTIRGRTPRPQISYSTDGGSFGTFRQLASVAGASKRVDYYSAYSHLDTDNQVANGQFQNDTYAGRFGVALGRTTDLGLVLHHNASDQGVPNAVNYFGISDDSEQRTRATTVGVSARTRFSDRLASEVRLSTSRQSLRLTNPSPTGEPSDPFGYGPNYVGDVVTIHAANDTIASGRAILDFGGTYPQRYETESRRHSFNATVDYRIRPAFSVAGGLRLDDEHGENLMPTTAETSRRDVGAFVEARGVFGRLFVNAGLAADHHTVFKSTVVPRVSVAAYLRTPKTDARWGETKLTFNGGKGVKAPSLLQELASLYELAQASPEAAVSVDPLRPERSTGIDAGVEQAALGGRVRLSLTWFDNRFRDLVEFVDTAGLIELGFDDAALEAAPYGAYVNAQSYHGRGVETSAQAVVLRRVQVGATYTFLSARVTESFSTSALTPTYNPAYPDQPIGAYSPLVGGRPFRRPAHSGTLGISYLGGRISAMATAVFSGGYDESTFLTDEYFGSSLLLPNDHLAAGYRTLDVSASMALRPQLTAYASVENLWDAHYEAAVGYPALGRTIRAGLRVSVGADKPAAASPARQR